MKRGTGLLVLALVFLVAASKKAKGMNQANRMTLVQLRELARSVGFPDPELAAAVAMAESGGNAGVLGDLTLGVSVGLWQINLRAHPQYSQDALTDPHANAIAALAISSRGTNWHPWTTYNTGAYKKYLPTTGDA